MSEGIKVGGYPTWTQDPYLAHVLRAAPGAWTTCATINSAEFDGESWRTWLPVEDTPATGTIWDLPYEERSRIQCAPGLMLGDMGGIYLFECLRCPDGALRVSLGRFLTFVSATELRPAPHPML
ncbi:hypothetical protein [Streptomyces sp. KL116D]|uniref:hypothetical protein n=1 Tax=Streptomyces sp. KL116D TaxID=3045152 RepID=UPI003558751B